MNLFSILVPIFYRFIAITTQQTNTSKVNKIRCIPFKILTSIFFLNSLQIFHVHGHFEDYEIWNHMHFKTPILNLGRLTPVVPILLNGGISCETFTSFLLSYWSLYPVYDGLNVQSFRQMYWNLRDFMSILRWTDHEL